MGFGSILKGIGKVGAVVGAPFTGGASLAAIPAIDAIGTIGEIAGDIAGSRAKGREAEANINTQRDQQRLQDILAQRNQDTQMASLNLEAPQTRMAQAIRGGIVSSGMPNFSMQAPPGVHKPAMTGMMGVGNISDTARQAGDAMQRQALLKMLSGETVPTHDFAQTELPKAGLFDKILGVASAAGGFSQAFRPQAPIMASTSPSITRAARAGLVQPGAGYGKA
jgi:hypothetical protein